MRKRTRPRLAAGRPSLLGLAPGGVCPAAAVAGSAVRSYRTISPLPRRPKASIGGMFLWHFPWGRPRRPLAGTVFPWSPDFPRFACDAEARPSGHLAAVYKGVPRPPVKPMPRRRRSAAAFHRRPRRRNFPDGNAAGMRSAPEPCARRACRSPADRIRSEERRVGKECNGQCRSRWSPYH